MTAHETTATRGLSLPAGDGLLRFALKTDALVTGANGAAYVALAGPIGDLLGMPAGFLRAVGAFLLVFAAAVWLVGSRETLSRAPALAIALANLGWVAASVVVLAAGAHDPTTTGAVWIGLQAATVELFAVLQLAGLRRAAA